MKDNNSTGKTDTYWQDLIQNRKSKAYLGGLAISTTINVIYTPCENFKVLRQTEPHKSIVEATKHIWQNGGVKAYARGIVPNILRSIVRQTYQAPTLHLMPDVLKKFNDQGNHNAHPLLIDGFCTLFGATIDSVFSCPLDRIKIYQMTSYPAVNTLQAFSKLKYKNLYTGFNVTLAKQVVYYGGLHIVDDALRPLFDSFSPQKPNDLLSTIVRSTATTSIVTLINTPLDVVKTYAQKKDTLEGVSIAKAAQHIYKTNGRRAFTNGLGARLFGNGLWILGNVLLKDHLSHSR